MWKTSCSLVVKVLLGCRFNFKAYVNNVREIATKCSLKTTEVLLRLMYMCLTRFDIYHGKVAPNCFKSHINSR